MLYDILEYLSIMPIVVVDSICLLSEYLKSEFKQMLVFTHSLHDSTSRLFICFPMACPFLALKISRILLGSRFLGLPISVF